MTVELTAEESVARSELYRFFADALRYPDATVAAAFAAVPATAGAVGEALDRLRGAVRGFDAARLESEFVRTFGHAVPREFPPYETEFTSSQSTQQTAELSDIAGFYGAFGLRPREGMGERVDSLGVELEFLYFMALKEARARSLGQAENAAVTADATRKFLCQHVGRWAFAFAKRLADKGGSALYAALADALAAWLRADLARLGVPEPQQVHEPALLRAKTPDDEADEALAATEAALGTGAPPGDPTG